MKMKKTKVVQPKHGKWLFQYLTFAKEVRVFVGKGQEFIISAPFDVEQAISW